MTWIRSSLLLLGGLLLLAGCGEEAPTDAPDLSRPLTHPLARALEDPDPVVRRHAAQDLARLPRAPRDAVLALVRAQDDPDADVAEAALAALEAIQPPGSVALRVYGPDCYETVEEQVRIAPEYVTWRKVACEPDAPMEGARLGACWRLVIVPAVYETRTKPVLVHVDRARWHDAERVKAGDVPMVHPTPPPPPQWKERELPPGGEPEGAQAGEVWCWYESEGGKTWRRHPECEGPRAAR